MAWCKLPLAFCWLSVSHVVGNRYNKSNTFDARLFRRGRRSGKRVKSKEILRHNKIETIATDQDLIRNLHIHGSLQSTTTTSSLYRYNVQLSTLLKSSKPPLLAVINTRSLNANGFKLKDSIVILTLLPSLNPGLLKMIPWQTTSLRMLLTYAIRTQN